jgi:hypothetical protein
VPNNRISILVPLEGADDGLRMEPVRSQPTRRWKKEFAPHKAQHYKDRTGTGDDLGDFG